MDFLEATAIGDEKDHEQMFVAWARHVRSWGQSGHCGQPSECPLMAISGHGFITLTPNAIAHRWADFGVPSDGLLPDQPFQKIVPGLT